MVALSCMAGICRAENPGVLLVNKREVLECVIDTNLIEETGAFILLFSNGLETGSREKYAGMTGVDYKLEDGTLSRFTGDPAGPWQTLANLKLQKVGSWQVYALPKVLFLKPAGLVEWRGIFFPHNHEPALVPAQGAGRLKLSDDLDVPGYRPGVLPVEYFARISGNGQVPAAMPLFLSGGNLRLPVTHASGAAAPPLRPGSFNLPEPDCLVWPDAMDKKASPWVQDGAIGHRLGGRFKAVLFGMLEHAGRQDILRARVQACQLTERHAYFYVRSAADLPAGAAGAVFRHGPDFRGDILAMQKLREQFHGPMWVQVDESFWKLAANDRDLLVKAWLLFELKPLLPPGQVLEGISHRQTVFLIWHMLHVDKMREGGRKFENHLPLPTQVNDEKMLRHRRVALDSYLTKLHGELQQSFAQACPGGA